MKEKLKNKIYASILQICSSLALIHLIFTVIFLLLKVYILSIFNFLVVILYIFQYFMTLYKPNYMVFYILANIEILIQLIITPLCIGWEPGFFLYGFGWFLTTNNIITVIRHENNVNFNFKGSRIPVLVIIAATPILTNIFPPIYTLGSIKIIGLFIFNAISFFYLLTSRIDENTKYLNNWETKLSIIAQKDELTTLFNRHKMRDFFTELHSGFLNDKYEFAITIVDIDDFKNFNDTYGHDAGDFILKELANIFLSFSHRYKDDDILCLDIGCPDMLVCRWGGEEFLFAQTYEKNIEDAISEINKIFDTVRNHDFVYKGKHLNVTLTGGMSEHEFGNKINETIENADINLYKGKQSGKNKLVF